MTTGVNLIASFRDYMVIYIYDNKCIGVYYDGAFGSTGGRVFRVVIWDKDKE